jgi:Ca2+-binding EF-hand superfamily protein
MTSLTPEQVSQATQAFNQSDEGNKGFLHSKEFFYATQALGFKYTFVETFAMYQQYDDNNSLRMNIEEFKRFYEAKLKDPASHVDPTKVSNVYNKTGSNGAYIQGQSTGTTYRTATTVQQPIQTTTSHTTYTSSQPVTQAYTSSTTQGRVVRAAPTTTYTTGTTGYATVNQEMSKYDVEGKGYITKEQLRTACQDLAVKCDTDQDLDNIWNEIDNNGSGKINGIEFGEFYDYVKGFRDEVRQYQAQTA